MLNIEVIKFEAQDVITASGVAKCACHNTCEKDKYGIHTAPGTNGADFNLCTGIDGKHTCGK